MWYLDMFKFMLQGVKGPLWQIAQVWNLILLQNADGSFDISDELATALRAGEPDVPLDDAAPIYNDDAVRESIPSRLTETCNNKNLSEVSVVVVVFFFVPTQSPPSLRL